MPRGSGAPRPRRQAPATRSTGAAPIVEDSYAFWNKIREGAKNKYGPENYFKQDSMDASMTGGIFPVKQSHFFKTMLEVVGKDYYKLNNEADEAIKKVMMQKDTNLFEYSCCKDADKPEEFNFIDVIIMNCDTDPEKDNIYVVKQFYCSYIYPIRKPSGWPFDYLPNQFTSFYVDLTHLDDEICVKIVKDDQGTSRYMYKIDSRKELTEGNRATLQLLDKFLRQRIKIEAGQVDVIKRKITSIVPRHIFAKSSIAEYEGDHDPKHVFSRIDTRAKATAPEESDVEQELPVRPAIEEQSKEEEESTLYGDAQKLAGLLSTMIGLGVTAVQTAGKKAYDTVSAVGELSPSFGYSITGKVAEEADIPETRTFEADIPETRTVEEPTGMSVASIEPTTREFGESQSKPGIMEAIQAAARRVGEGVGLFSPSAPKVVESSSESEGEDTGAQRTRVAARREGAKEAEPKMIKFVWE